MGFPADQQAGSPSCIPSSSALNPPFLGLSPPSSQKGPRDSPNSLSLPVSPTRPPPPFRSPLCPSPGPALPSPCPSYFLAVTSQRHPDVRPQIASRDLGFRSEILYFCTTGWAPGLRQRKRSPRCHLCLHPRGCHSPLPPGSGRGPAGTSQALRWALGPLGRAACLWPKCGVVQLCLPGPQVPAPRAPSCMANTTLPPSPVTSPP